MDTIVKPFFMQYDNYFFYLSKKLLHKVCAIYGVTGTVDYDTILALFVRALKEEKLSLADMNRLKKVCIPFDKTMFIAVSGGFRISVSATTLADLFARLPYYTWPQTISQSGKIIAFIGGDFFGVQGSGWRSYGKERRKTSTCFTFASNEDGVLRIRPRKGAHVAKKIADLLRE